MSAATQWSPSGYGSHLVHLFPHQSIYRINKRPPLTHHIRTRLPGCHAVPCHAISFHFIPLTSTSRKPRIADSRLLHAALPSGYEALLSTGYEARTMRSGTWTSAQTWVAGWTRWRLAAHEAGALWCSVLLGSRDVVQGEVEVEVEVEVRLHRESSVSRSAAAVAMAGDVDVSKRYVRASQSSTRTFGGAPHSVVRCSEGCWWCPEDNSPLHSLHVEPAVCVVTVTYPRPSILLFQTPRSQLDCWKACARSGL